MEAVITSTISREKLYKRNYEIDKTEVKKNGENKKRDFYQSLSEILLLIYRDSTSND